jgi:hypothetical protein
LASWKNCRLSAGGGGSRLDGHDRDQALQGFAAVRRPTANASEISFTAVDAQASTELEQCPSDLIEDSCGLAGITWSIPGKACVHQGRRFTWMTNENQQTRGNGPLKACAKRLLRKKRKSRARRGTICLRALSASKNALKAPMEKAQKKNKKGERVQRARRGDSLSSLLALLGCGAMSALRRCWDKRT